MDNKICSLIVSRAYKLDFYKVYDIIGNLPFILAGGALCGDVVNDFDIYPSNGHKFEVDAIAEYCGTHKDIELVCKTKNALTVKVGGQTLQFCTYCKPSLKELVDSFDFSHIQVGIEFDGGQQPPLIEGVYYTDAFVFANVSRTTEYVGSEYPLSSLIRTFKYVKRNKFHGRGYIRPIFKILTDILNRGYKDYRDFKDQLDAIDLGVSEWEGSKELYKALVEHGLVESENHGDTSKKMGETEEKLFAALSTIKEAKNRMRYYFGDFGGTFKNPQLQNVYDVLCRDDK